MSSSRAVGAAQDHGAGSWATEGLPMAVRRQLLERELSRLGFRRTQAHDAATPAAQAGPFSAHPQAEGGGAHGD